MRILFENKVEHSTVSAANGSLNYPPENIWDPFLWKKFKSRFGTDILTIDLAEISDLNCFFMAFHNVAIGSVVFLDGTLTPVGPSLDLASAQDIFVAYFDTISVRRITVTIEAATGQVFVGGIGSGVFQQMPVSMTRGSEFGISDATDITQSPAGQVSRNKAPGLRLRSFTWPDLSESDRAEIDPTIVALGIGKQVYMDLYEGERSFDPPMYAVVTEPRRMTFPSANRYSLNMTFQEAR